MQQVVQWSSQENPAIEDVLGAADTTPPHPSTTSLHRGARRDQASSSHSSVTSAAPHDVLGSSPVTDLTEMRRASG